MKPIISINLALECIQNLLPTGLSTIGLQLSTIFTDLLTFNS